MYLQFGGRLNLRGLATICRGLCPLPARPQRRAATVAAAAADAAAAAKWSARLLTHRHPACKCGRCARISRARDPRRAAAAAAMLLIHHDCRQRSPTCHITRIVAVLSRDEVVHRPPAIVLLEERMLGKKATDADRLSWGALGEQSPTF